MFKKTKSTLATTLSVAMLATMVTIPAAAATATTTSTKLEGQDRYETALKIVQHGWETSKSVVIARGDDLADALSAAPLAYAKEKAPILLTKTGELPTGVLAELKELGVETVYIVGGKGAVSTAVEKELEEYNVVRIEGKDRIETSYNIANEAFKTAPEKVVIADAYAYADALSVSSIAAKEGMPIILVNGELTADQAAYVAGKEVYAVGGTGVLSAEVVSAAKAERISGVNRYATNAAILAKFKQDYSNIYLAKGAAANLVDSLAGSALAALGNNPIVLVDGNNKISAELAAIVRANITDDSTVVALGGTVSNAAVNAAEALKLDEVVAGDLVVKSVVSINAAQIKVTFNKELTGDDKDEAEDLDNYTLNDVKGDEIDDILFDVEVEEGSNEAILTVNKDEMNGGDDDYQNQASFELVIGEDVTGTEVTKEFKVSDFDIPQVESVQVAGIKTIKVKISEPVVVKDDKELKDCFEVNGGDYSIDKVTPINNGKELNIVLYSDLEDGEDLTVDVKSEAEDFAGYSLKKGTFELKATFDNADIAIASYKKAKDNEITLVFNKDIKFANKEDDTQLAVSTTGDYVGWKLIDADTLKGLYHSSDNNKVEAAEIDGNELTLYFATDNELPEIAYVYVDADVLVDLWDEKNNDVFVKATISKDNVKPEVKTIEQDDDANDKIVITFSEDMETASATEKDNYTVQDKDGKNVRISNDIKLKDDEVTLTVSNDLENGDIYKVTIEDVKDEAGNKVEDTTKEFTAKETSAVDNATARYYDESKSDQKIVVDFDTTMLADGSRYAINNLENYDLKVGDFTVNLADYDGASIRAIESDNKVEIKLPGNDADDFDADAESFDFAEHTGEGDISLSINKVDDTNENRSDLYSIKVEGSAKIGLDDVKESPVATDVETITVVFDEELSFENDDIMIGSATADIAGVNPDIYKTVDEKEVIDADKFTKITPSSTKVVKEDGKTTVTYTLNEDDQLSFNGKLGTKDVYVVTTNTTESENSFGDELVGDTAWKVMDEITPELAKLKELSGESTTTVVEDTKLDDRDDLEDAVKLVQCTLGKVATETDAATTGSAKVELHFEESLSDANMNKYAFDTDNSDVAVTDVEFTSAKVVTLTLKVDADAAADYDEIEDFLGLGITTKTNEIFDANEAANGANGTIVSVEIEIVEDAVNAAAAAVAATANLLTATDAEALLNSADYVDYSAVTAALGMDEVTTADKIAKTTAINDAIDELVTVASVNADLLAATDAEALLNSVDYVDYSAVTAALGMVEVTTANKIAKTTAINDAIAALVLK